MAAPKGSVQNRSGTARHTRLCEKTKSKGVIFFIPLLFSTEVRKKFCSSQAARPTCLLFPLWRAARTSVRGANVKYGDGAT